MFIGYLSNKYPCVSACNCVHNTTMAWVHLLSILYIGTDTPTTNHYLIPVAASSVSSPVSGAWMAIVIQRSIHLYFSSLHCVRRRFNLYDEQDRVTHDGNPLNMLTIRVTSAKPVLSWKRRWKISLTRNHTQASGIHAGLELAPRTLLWWPRFAGIASSHRTLFKTS